MQILDQAIARYGTAATPHFGRIGPGADLPNLATSTLAELVANFATARPSVADGLPASQRGRIPGLAVADRPLPVVGRGKKKIR